MGNGRLEATEVQIASKVPGRLAEVRVDEGDKVVRGQLLARIDTRTMEAQRNQAEAEANASACPWLCCARFVRSNCQCAASQRAT